MNWLESLLWDPTSVAHIVLPVRIRYIRGGAAGQD